MTDITLEELDTIVCGNALDVLPMVEANSVHCSVSSPPYYSLRVYSGNQVCKWSEIEYSPMSGLPPICVEAMTCALGNEKTIESYIGHLVAIYREVYRVLREDGCCFVVMGDSYAQAKGHGHWECRQGKGDEHGQRMQQMWRNKGASDIGLKQGDLMMVPHRLALALQADGWIVRNDLVWHKKAPMPESVAGHRWERHRIKVKKSDRASNLYQNGAGTKQGAGVVSRAQREAYYEKGEGASKWEDCLGCPKCEMNGGYVLKRGSWRHTRAHEFVFMMVKKMQYFADQEKVREATLHPNATGTYGTKHAHAANWQYSHSGREYNAKNTSGRNPRSVLSPKPSPSGLKHFAIFPTSLIEPLIKATCPDKCCPECGKGWAPIVRKETCREHGGIREMNKTPLNVVRAGWRKGGPESNVLGYCPTCECGHEGLLLGDLEYIHSPTGKRTVEDPSLETGRAGYNRLRGPNEGSRPITRYEQRMYAQQLKKSPHRDKMESEAGSAFAHYIRTDKSGARPAPQELLDKWIDQIEVPKGKELEPIPGTVLDPFMGAGTTALAAIKLGRHYYGCDISQEYVEMANKRIETVQMEMCLT